jgi:hypothetical protein
MPRKELIFTGGTFLSPGDEKALFNWLRSIPCVEGVEGHSNSLHVMLRKQPSNSELRELIALTYRYALNMRPLAALKNARNAAWFGEDKGSFWHRRIFGNQAQKKAY